MDVFDLVAKIKMDLSEYEDGLGEASRKTNNFSQTLTNGLATVGKAIGKASLVALGSATAGVVALTKQSVDAYSNYEQLVGGIETLFGAQGMSLEEYAKSVGKTTDECKKEYDDLISAQNTVFANSSMAWQTAGVSMNQYMEQVTSFSASLKQSVETEQEAADISNMAIIDMSDNANKMGSSMESIQNAYQGFAKQNYTMLDNLKLGYGGTKEEMARLLEDATALSGVEYDIDNLADVFNAIHVIQGELGITGTTSKEATSTISGSLNAMKSAWDNVLVGIADENADFESQIDALVESASTFAENIVPRIEKALGGIGDLIGKLAPIVGEKLPTMLQELLPGVISAISSLLSSVAEALPSLLNTIINELPGIIEILVEVLPTLLSSLLNILPDVLSTAIEIVVLVVNGVADMLPTLLPQIVDTIVNLITTLLSNANGILGAALGLIQGLVDGILAALPILIDALPEIILGIVDFILSAIPQIIECGITLLTSLIDALPQIIDGICKALPDIIVGIIDALLDCTPQLVDAGFQLLISLTKNLPKAIIQIVTAIPKIVNALAKKLAEVSPTFVNKVKDVFNQLVENSKTWGKDLMDAFIDGIKSKINALTDGVKDVANTVKSFLGFSEPEKGPLSNFHTYAPDMMELFTKGIYENEDLLTDAITDVFDVQSKMNNPQIEVNTKEQSAPVENNISITLEGDMANLFRAFIKENDKYIKANGNSAFAY